MPRQERDHQPFDYVGMVIFGVIIACLMLLMTLLHMVDKSIHVNCCNRWSHCFSCILYFEKRRPIDSFIDSFNCADISGLNNQYLKATTVGTMSSMVTLKTILRPVGAYHFRNYVRLAGLVATPGLTIAGPTCQKRK